MNRGWVVSPEYRAAIDTLVAARKDQGVGQRELARRLGKHSPFMNKVEKLERRLDLIEFIAIAQALELDPEALLKRILDALPAKVSI